MAQAQGVLLFHPPAGINYRRDAVLASRLSSPSFRRTGASGLKTIGAPQRWSMSVKTGRNVCVAQAVEAAAAGGAGATSRPLKVMIAGPPAAGKGTQCQKIVEKYGLVHISVGDLLRAEVAAGTPGGLKAKSFMDAGKLVPNEVVVGIVVDRLAQDDVVSGGWLLDGYPRSAEQAEPIQEAGIIPELFILIVVPDDVLVERVSGRRMDPRYWRNLPYEVQAPAAQRRR
eukprot:jgi/Botrbrau1/613/Bobra.0161s0009.1